MIIALQTTFCIPFPPRGSNNSIRPSHYCTTIDLSTSVVLLSLFLSLLFNSRSSFITLLFVTSNFLISNIISAI